MPDQSSPRLRVWLSTVGCRANQADSDELAVNLDTEAVVLVATPKDADLAVVNTCCVTAEAERDCRKLAHRALAAAPNARVVLVGCAVNALAHFGVDMDPRVMVRSHVEAEPTALAAWINGLAGSATPAAPPLHPHRFELGRSRPQLKVQTGCSHGCAYCIVPRARGQERSMPLAEVVRRAALLAAEGFGEIVLVGVQLGAFGVDLPGRPSLAALITAVARAVAPSRVRLGSVEPWSVDTVLAEALALPNVCPHLHVPLQSGDDGVLLAMRRGYTVANYLARIEILRTCVPGIALGTDVLLGFPGEDAAAFERTLEIVQQLAPAYLHAFPYSPRSGTQADSLPRDPSREVAKARVRAIRAQGDAARTRYRQELLGTTRQVLIEEPKRSLALGITDNFVPVRLQGEDTARTGALVRAEIQGDPAAMRLGARIIGA